MRKTLLALICGSLLALPAVASAKKHHQKRAHVSKKAKHRKLAQARPHLVLTGEPAAPAPAAKPAPAPAAKPAPAPAPEAPIVQQVRDDEAPKR
jgi:hypothetical protein